MLIIYTVNTKNVIYAIKVSFISQKIRKTYIDKNHSCWYHYTQGDSDVISSYHIYASCFSAML